MSPNLSTEGGDEVPIYLVYDGLRVFPLCVTVIIIGGQEEDGNPGGGGQGEGNEGFVGNSNTPPSGHQAGQPAFVVTGIAAVIKEVLTHPGGKASGESAAFLRVLANMSADTVAAPGPANDHDGGGGEGSGVDGSRAVGGNGDQGGAGIAAIDDAEAFHLKTVRKAFLSRADGGHLGAGIQANSYLFGHRIVTLVDSLLNPIISNKTPSRSR